VTPPYRLAAQFAEHALHLCLTYSCFCGSPSWNREAAPSCLSILVYGVCLYSASGWRENSGARLQRD
jgi:hypothetical protein